MTFFGVLFVLSHGVVVCDVDVIGGAAKNLTHRTDLGLEGVLLLT